MSNAHLEQSEAALPDWGLLVKGIRSKDAASLERFYGIFSASTRSLALRQLRDQDAAADCSSQCLMLAVEGIREGRLLEPAAIAGYIWGILRNLLRKAIAVRIADRGRRTDQVIELLPDKAISPESNAILSQQREDIRNVLAAMPPMAREILARFYLDGSSATQIQHDLGITPTQFRLIKNRAKATLVQDVRASVPPVIRRPVVRKTRVPLISPKMKTLGIAASLRRDGDMRTVASASRDFGNVSCLAS